MLFAPYFTEPWPQWRDIGMEHWSKPHRSAYIKKEKAKGIKASEDLLEELEECVRRKLQLKN
jgi:hypothetical protein